MMGGIPSHTQKFLLDIGRLQKRSERAQRWISSGLKLTNVSDAPQDISRLLDARAGLERVVQVKYNLGRVQLEVDTAEQSLQNGVQLLERARTLASQGASGHQSAATRQQIAGELQGILERMVQVANTAVEGRYLLSGDSDQIAPYQLDPTTQTGVGPYQGTASNRLIADASGLEFAVAQTADVVFDTSDQETNVFGAINGMRRALLAVDSPPDLPDPTLPTIEEAMHNLGSATIYLNERLAQYGITQNRVSDALTSAQKLEISFKKQVAQVEEADLAEAAVELNQSQIHLEAAFTAKGQTPRRSLFDYLG